MNPPPCPVCRQQLGGRYASAVDVEYQTTADRFDYWLCPRCDCLAIDPVPRERLAEIYPPDYYSFAGGAGALGRRTLVTRVKEALDRRTFRSVLDAAGTRAPRVLDVGGGTGEICAGLLDAAEPGARGMVVDIDPTSTAEAARRGLDVATSRFEEFGTTERFDVILMLNLIEHVEDPLAVLQHARGLLAERGVIWLQTPNFRSLDARIFRHRNWAGYHCPRHWVIFGEQGLRSALESASLHPVSIRYTQAGAFWAASILGLPRSRRSVQRGRPLVRHPLFQPLAALGAGVDFATRRIRRTSQIICLARPA